MRHTLHVLAVAGHVAALQLVAGVLVWWLSPWPWLSLLATALWLGVLVMDLRHPRFAGILPRWQRLIAFMLAQGPALVFGAWNVLYFCGLAPRFELGAFVVHLWLTPLAPLLAWCPTGTLLERDLWLWALSIAPFLLVIGAAAVPRRALNT
jgi:hypothetical protein